ncbi:MAG: 50S ribosomal protein L29 [Candidatus Magasanikbacteria bacterium CG_4_10_14_0_2_um_filter_37_12]|uniref:Large ribosomal subunit protein uL29 n=1 Tax=Candidatus Magasanikbacteria bacterium CG_4_10_14_0_2_um_filter_37_12 TaxID=1974637 RepID=A0A2M7V8N4_9BACT|nr:MAG: 50S ribosomal protein L29 [Candidatus Magasanikbacteria bacterium CG_4_10_14_0_2_um_filter_37_12]
MDIKELQRISEKQLQTMLAEKRNDVRELRFQSSEGQLKKVRSIRVLKKEIAQIMTVLNNKQHLTNTVEEK